MWDPKQAKREAAQRAGLSEQDIAKAEKAADHASHGPIGAQIRELFESQLLMASAMQAMDLTHEFYQQGFLALKKMEDGALTRGVCLGLVMNNIMILKVLQQSSVEILDLTSRAVELASLFEDATMETLGSNPFNPGTFDGED